MRVFERFRALAAALLPILIGIAAMQPLLRGQLPLGADVFLHFYRLIALDALVKQGVLFSRWFPNLAFGYGYPIFQYYPPLPHYVALTLSMLGLGPVWGLNGAFIAFSCIGAISAGGWARSVFGARASVVAGAIYAFAPYTLFNVFERAALAEFAALAILPMTLWAMHRAVMQPGLRPVAVVAICMAALMLCHNITAMVSAPILTIYALALAVLRWRDERREIAPPIRPTLHPAMAALVRTTAGLAIGLGVSAFFWLPAFLERDLTRLDRALSTAYDFRSAFVAGRALFDWPTPIEADLINSQFALTLSPVALMLGACALVRISLRRTPLAQRLHGALFALLALTAAMLATAASQPIWEALPLLRFVLYPSRFLGLASLGLAMLAASLFTPAPGTRTNRVLTVVAALAVVASQVFGFFWQQPLLQRGELAQTATAIPEIERRTGIIGTTSIGEYAPRAVREWPAADAGIAGFFRTAPGVALRDAQITPLRGDVIAQSGTAHTLTIGQFFFEGWRAQIDGIDAPVGVSDPNGLMTLAVPAGEHRIGIWFGSTPLRDTSTAASVAALVVLLLLVIRRGEVQTLSDSTVRSSARGLAAAMSVALLSGLALKHAWIDTGTNAWRRAAAPTTALAHFEDRLELVDGASASYDPATNSVAVTLLWRAAQDRIPDYSFNVRLVDAVGERIASVDHAHADLVYPTSRLSAGVNARDSYRIGLPPGTPPGDYRVEVSAYPFGAPDRPIRPVGAADTAVTAAQVSITRPAQRADHAQIEMQSRASDALAPGYTLRGVTVPLQRIRVGEAMPLTLLWQIGDGARAGAEVCFGARTFRGERIALGCRSLPAAWRAGDVWRVPYRVRVPVRLASDRYELVAMIDEREAFLGEIDIDAPERLTVPPPSQVLQRAAWSDAGELIGYTLPERGQAGAVLPVELIWQATRETERKYTVVVFLLDGKDQPYAAHESQPGQDAQPTSAWLPGAYVRDAHALTLPTNLPAGRYRVAVRLYDTYALTPLALAEGGQVLILSQRLEVE